MISLRFWPIYRSERSLKIPNPSSLLKTIDFHLYFFNWFSIELLEWYIWVVTEIMTLKIFAHLLRLLSYIITPVCQWWDRSSRRWPKVLMQSRKALCFNKQTSWSINKLHWYKRMMMKILMSTWLLKWRWILWNSRFRTVKNAEKNQSIHTEVMC